MNLKQARIPAEDGVPFLMKLLDHKAEVVKRSSIRMLGVYGPEAKSATPTLQNVMSADPIRNLRDDAMLALTRIEPKNAEIAAAIFERLGAKGADDSTNRAVLQALIAILTLMVAGGMILILLIGIVWASILLLRTPRQGEGVR